MRSVRVDDAGTRLRWAQWPGEGRLRVYLHGLGSAGLAAFWPVLTHPVAGRCPAMVPDLLGFGLSDRPVDGDYTLQMHADAVASALDDVGLTDVGIDDVGLTGVDLVGHSMGGSIALVLARRRPELVARLVLVEPNLDPGDGGASVWIARQSEQEFVDRGLGILIRGAADGWASTLRIADPRALHRSAVGLCRGSTPTMREILLGLEIPRTLIWGALSTAPAGLDRLVSAGAAFCAVGGSGHVPMEDNPAGFAELLEDALRVPSGD